MQTIQLKVNSKKSDHYLVQEQQVQRREGEMARVGTREQGLYPNTINAAVLITENVASSSRMVLGPHLFLLRLQLFQFIFTKVSNITGWTSN